MNRIRTRVAALAGMMVLLLAPMTNAQSRPSLRVNIPFGFKAGKRSLPAGTYVFTKEKFGQISLASTERAVSLQVPVIRSLARSGEGDDHLLAFEKVGDERILSEIWLPAQEGVGVS